MSTTPKHTPGPWAAINEPIQRMPNWGISTSDGRWVATLHARPHRNDTDVMLAANAHLIAAAPSLLAACRMVDAAFNTGAMWEACKAVRDAIAKAEGES